MVWLAVHKSAGGGTLAAAAAAAHDAAGTHAAAGPAEPCWMRRLCPPSAPAPATAGGGKPASRAGGPGT
jgi:hypothetical protein